MFGSRSLLLALVGWGMSVAAATEVVYVTDLSVFTVLAPCAQAAVSGVINYETVSNCPEGASALQSCICSKNDGGNRRAISASISDSIDYSSTATDDQASAASVLSAYCSQDAITPFPEPSHAVSQYIVDLSAYNNLAPCAQSGLSGVVFANTWDRCQEDASLLASCACKKNQNSELAISQLTSSIKYYCNGHSADLSSAQEVFAGYCGLVDGTSSFPETTDPPGDMTYHITALKEYKSLAKCAQSAVSSNVLLQTENLCPSGPQALASCACLRQDMTGFISSLITSDVRYYCESTAAADDISSALDVWNLYCSAAKGLTTPVGVSVSTPPTSRTRTNGAQETGKQDAEGNDNTDSNGTGPDNTMSNTAVIAGAVVGSVVGTALIALVAFLLYRRSKKAQAAALAPAVSDTGKPELDSTAIVGPSTGSPSPSLMKSPMDNHSPVSALSSPGAPPMPELHNQPPPIPEVHGQHTPITPHEAYSHQVYEAPGQSQPPVPGSHGQPTSGYQGMGWQSGPVPQAYEMDGGDSRNQPPPHAQ